jgi:hypothetical protein
MLSTVFITGLIRGEIKEMWGYSPDSKNEKKNENENLILDN